MEEIEQKVGSFTQERKKYILSLLDNYYTICIEKANLKENALEPPQLVKMAVEIGNLRKRWIKGEKNVAQKEG